MKKFRALLKVFVLLMVLSFVSPAVLPISGAVTAQAAAVKLSQKELTLEVGKSQTLKITGTKQKAAWTSSNKSVATVGKTGKVTAKEAGTATITATVNKKKYSCKVTAFESQKLTSGKVSYVIPKDWTSEVLLDQNGSAALQFFPKSADITNPISFLEIVISYTGTTKTEYSTAKEYLETLMTEEYLTNLYSQGGTAVTISDIKMSDYESKLGTAFKSEFNAKIDDLSMDQIIYDIFLDDYVIEVQVWDIGDNTKPDVALMGEYLLNSITVKK